MPRLSSLNDILFPVQERPVFVTDNDGASQRLLSVSDKRAIVDSANWRVLGIVSRDYRLVTNRQALDWGFQCCRAAFPETDQIEWEVRFIDAPATGGHCFIDLVHTSSRLDFNFVPTNQRPEPFAPFLRVTNSYNGLRALAFDIGFFRRACTNGLIIYDSIIRFKFTHLRRNIGPVINFEIAHERLETLKTRLGEYLGVLRGCVVGREELEPFVRAVLSLRPSASMKPNTREADEWAILAAHISELCVRYRRESGENAYAVFNAVTEFASHPPANCHVHRERHSLQRLAGAWLTDFVQRCHQPGFSVTSYLEELMKTKSDAGSAEQGNSRNGGGTELATRRVSFQV